MYYIIQELHFIVKYNIKFNKKEGVTPHL